MESGTKTIGKIIQNSFNIPSYQRGYRWSENNVRQLLEDIYEKKKIGDFEQGLIDEIRDDDDINKYVLLNSHIAQQDKYGRWKCMPDKMYCIQPLVVVPKKEGSGSHYDVIDGQQRITTISIFLAALKSMGAKLTAKIRLKYSSREKSAELMDQLYEIDDINTIGLMRSTYCNNIDFDHIFHAFEVASQYFEELGHSFNASEQFGAEAPVAEYYDYLLFALLHSVEVIWYDASHGAQDLDEQKVFANFNTGKLPLTNSELIKAIFMNPANFGEEANENSIKDRQTVISEKWDTIETELHNPDFWAFVPHQNQYSLYNENGKYNETRIDAIFDFLVMQNWLDQNKSKTAECYIWENTNRFKEEYYTFYEIEKWIDGELKGSSKNKREVMDQCWGKARKIYASIKEIFSDSALHTEWPSRLYNLAGLYIYAANLQRPDGKFNTSILRNNEVYEAEPYKYLTIFAFLNKIASIPRNQRERELKRELRNMIFGHNGISGLIRKMKYSDIGEDRISICLLLYNILTVNRVKGVANRFNFLLFAKNTWQREHIFATQHEGIPDDEHFRKAILISLAEGMADDVDMDTKVDNAYLKYMNYRKRGHELAWPEAFPAGNGFAAEAVTDPEYKKAMDFCKKSFAMLQRYQHIGEADDIIGIDIADTGRRMALAKKIIEYRSNNNLFFKEIDIGKIVGRSISREQGTHTLTQFKENLIASLKKELHFDTATQIEYVFADYPKENDGQTPYDFLYEPIEDDKANALIRNLRNNIVRAYQRKLEGIIWFTADDKIDILREGNGIESRYDQKYAEWKTKSASGNEGEAGSNTDGSHADAAASVSEKKHTDTARIRSILDIANEDDLDFVQKAVELNKAAMADEINSFFANDYASALADDSMGNMALLPGKVNAKIGNLLYQKKSDIIYKASQNGHFVPLSTLFVFTGAFSSGSIVIREWLPESRLKYLRNIVETFENAFREEA